MYVRVCVLPTSVSDKMCPCAPHNLCTNARIFVLDSQWAQVSPTHSHTGHGTAPELLLVVLKACTWLEFVMFWKSCLRISVWHRLGWNLASLRKHVCGPCILVLPARRRCVLPDMSCLSAFVLRQHPQICRKDCLEQVVFLVGCSHLLKMQHLDSEAFQALLCGLFLHGLLYLTDVFSA